jgi:hypothetical protein
MGVEVFWRFGLVLGPNEQVGEIHSNMPFL